MLKIKPGASLLGLAPQMIVALIAAESAYKRRGADLVITSGSDGHHSLTSLHYAGHAIDLRTRNLKPGEAGDIARELKEALGEHFDVVLESDHLHLEYQQRRP